MANFRLTETVQPSISEPVPPPILQQQNHAQPHCRSHIHRAIKQVEKSGKQTSLTNGQGRGTGRLVLVLKAMSARVTAEWMAQQGRDGKRTKKKFGSYPSVSLADARAVFQRDFANLIQKGRSIKIATDTLSDNLLDR